jgi:cell division protein FtsW
LNSLIGLGNILIFQTIINVSSSLNLMPTKGMTLPFISYGGSSIISSSIIIGFILTLINYAKKE